MRSRASVSARERRRRTVHTGWTVAMLTAAFGACAKPPVGSLRSCAPVPANRMLAPAPGEVELLAGRYRFLVVTTVGASNPSRNSTTWEVVLERPDSARRALARERPFGRHSRTDLRLVGTRHREASPPVPVEWDDGLLM